MGGVTHIQKKKNSKCADRHNTHRSTIVLFESEREKPKKTREGKDRRDVVGKIAQTRRNWNTGIRRVGVDGLDDLDEKKNKNHRVSGTPEHLQ